MNIDNLGAALAANLTGSYIEINARDERRVLRDILAKHLSNFTDSFTSFFFDLADGLREVRLNELTGKLEFSDSDIPGWDKDDQEPHVSILKFIRQYKKRAFFFLADYHDLLPGGRYEKLTICREFKVMLAELQSQTKRVILLGQNFNFSPDFSSLLYRFKVPLPSVEEIRHEINLSLDSLTRAFKDQGRDWDQTEMSKPGIRDQMVRAAQGLTFDAIDDAIRFCVRRDMKFGQNIVESLYEFKLEELSKHDIEFSPAPDVSVGGFSNLKDWLEKRSILFSVDAQSGSSKLPPPRGIVLVGSPGTGKSLVSKMIGYHWSMPTLKLSMDSLLAGIVGESESNLRTALKLSEAIAPCALILDEVDKMFNKVSESNGDSGISQRLFGMLLTWMAEKERPVFVIATANSIKDIPPEFSRKGRFDEIFFVDLPNRQDRKEIFKAHLSKYGIEVGSSHDVSCITDAELNIISEATENFSGAEIGAIVDECAISAAYDKRAQVITVQDVLNEVRSTKPQALGSQEKINSIRSWARDNARPASAITEEESKSNTVSGMM